MTYTTVYRPSVDVAKPNFIAELYEVASKIEPSWIIAGDFNLVRWLIDRSGEYRGFGLMDSFNDYISVAGLNDVPLKKSHLHVVKKDTNTKVLKAGSGIYHYGSSIKIPGYHSRSARNGCIGSCPVTSIGAIESTWLKFEIFWLKYYMPREMVRSLWTLRAKKSIIFA